MINKDDLANFKEFLESGSSKAKLTQVVLVAIVLGALPFVVAGGVAVGNAVQIFNKKNKSKKYTNKQINNAITNLKRQKIVEYVSDKNGVTTIRITKKGESKLKSFSIDLLSIKKPAKWDKKWRVIMFDLPVRYRQARNALRFKLKQIGFIQLQKSVWIYPYPCEDELLFIADYYKVKQYVDILLVEELLNEDKFIRHFDIKN
jgi:DNA-binding transcriptional regulator PaaX